MRKATAGLRRGAACCAPSHAPQSTKSSPQMPYEDMRLRVHQRAFRSPLDPSGPSRQSLFRGIAFAKTKEKPADHPQAVILRFSDHHYPATQPNGSAPKVSKGRSESPLAVPAGTEPFGHLTQQPNPTGRPRRFPKGDRKALWPRPQARNPLAFIAQQSTQRIGPEGFQRAIGKPFGAPAGAYPLQHGFTNRERTPRLSPQTGHSTDRH